MANLFDKQIEKMQRLINYGVNENTDNGKSIVEYHAEGADGKTYGIIRECNKFYIKVAPKKDTALVAEDYDYIGGFNNRKENEYSSYNVASKQLELKMKSLNEAYQNNRKSTYQFKPVEKSEWQVNETKEMRAEINRFNDIMYNVNGILSEDKNFTVKHTLPEAPSSNPSDTKVNSPFTDTAVAKGDKDFKTKKSDYKKAGAPFNQDGTVDNADMESTKNPKSASNGDVYTEKPKYVETGVAGQKPSGAKSVKMNENKKVVKLTEEQVLAWRKENDNFMDKSQGTNIGSSAPFTNEIGEENNQKEAKTEPIKESENTVFNTDNQNSPKVGCGEIGDNAPFNDEVCEGSFFHNDNLPYDEQLPDTPDEIHIDIDEETEDIPFPEVGCDMEESDMEGCDMEGCDMEGCDGGEFDMDDEQSKTSFMESKIYNMVKEAIELSDFGKHPAFNKTPMTLPSNIEIELNGSKDWNDDSVKGDKPFGKKIGSSAPYSEKVINLITDMIYDRLSSKKKV